jgi:CRISPR/Cas system-associated protein Cas10 (large subunit of type III CRISPR-Cas system)
MNIGVRLLETALKRAKEKGYRAVSVAVFANNKNMLMLAVKQDSSRSKWSTMQNGTARTSCI